MTVIKLYVKRIQDVTELFLKGKIEFDDVHVLNLIRNGLEKELESTINEIKEYELDKEKETWLYDVAMSLEGAIKRKCKLIEMIKSIDDEHKWD